nr:hypothetical protein [Tanacetum cinerariifolium]
MVNPLAPTLVHNSNFLLLLVLGRERLSGPNYMDWIQNLRFTLRYENKEYVLDEQIPTIDDDITQEENETHQKHYDDANKVSCIMASSMSPELQKTFKNTWAYEMNQQLKEMFHAKESKERLDVVKSLMACKPKPGASICAFILEMKGYFDILESLNMVFDVELSINIIISLLLQTTKKGINKIDVPSTLAALVLTVGHNAKKRKTSHSNSKGKATKGKVDHGSKREDLKDEKVKKGSHSGSKGKLEVEAWKAKLSHEKQENHAFECISHNVNVILNVGSSNKLDKSKLWHSRLGHVNKKRIAQLQKDGVLESFDFKLDDVCESCLFGKMTKSPFTGSCEREAFYADNLTQGMPRWQSPTISLADGTWRAIDGRDQWLGRQSKNEGL